MSKRKIVVMGFPKSGNTWLARLLAEVLACPSKGYLFNDEGKDPVIEGLDRQSNLEVYKSHHTCDINNLKLFKKEDIKLDNCIYIVRDIRDLTVSAAFYFNCRKCERLAPKVFDREIQKLNTNWNGWNKHVSDWINKSLFYVRYEDLLTDTEVEVKRILAHLSIEVNDEHLINSINNQSFDVKKKKFIASGDENKTLFLRSGKIGDYKNHLSADQINRICKLYGNTMRRLGYEF